VVGGYVCGFDVVDGDVVEVGWLVMFIE